MSRATKITLAVVLGVIGLAIVAFFALPSTLGLETEGPAELTIGDRAEASIAAIFAEPGEAVQVDAAAQDLRSDNEASVESIEGVWRIAGDSVAGYRVFKDFVGGSEFEAVGRTSSIFGDLTIEGTAVTSGQFSVDVTTIRSDDERRDRAFRDALNAGLNLFASFQLTSPIELGDVPQSGEAVTVDVTGEVTLRGVTNEVEFPLTARLVGGEVQVAGAIDVVFADYEITPPRVPTIVVRDTGIIEFSLFFEQGTAT